MKRFFSSYKEKSEAFREKMSMREETNGLSRHCFVRCLCYRDRWVLEAIVPKDHLPKDKMTCLSFRNVSLINIAAN